MRLALAVLLALIPTTANASDWAYESAPVPIAYIDNGAAQLQFACRGGDFTVGFWVRAPHRTVAGAAAMSLAIVPDPKDEGVPAAAGASFAQDMPLIHLDGSSMIIRGPVAARWARIAREAKRTIRIAYVRSGNTLEVFDSNDFGAKGSAAAIKQVMDRCG